MDKLHHSPAFRLHRVQRLLRAHLLAILSDFEVTPEQYFMLMRLGEEDGIAQGCLGDPDLDDRASVSRQASALEARGLVVRRPDPDDARVVRVHLTDGGRAVLAALADRVQAERLRLFGGVAPEDLAALHRVIDHLESRLLAAR
jgi:DNA-binding MarR family transcriptional regulator